MDIDSLQMRIRQLNNQVVQMRREQDYQRVCVCGALCLPTPGPRLMMGYSAQLPYQSISAHGFICFCSCYVFFCARMPLQFF